MEIKVDAAGNFAQTIPLDETTGGTYGLQAVGKDSGLKADAAFTILPSVVLTPNAGPIGTTVTAEGHAFSSMDLLKDLKATFGEDALEFESKIDDEDNGHFTATFKVPDNKPNDYTVTFFEPPPSTASASATFILTPTTPLPEYPLGALIALIACLATFALYTKRKSRPNLKRQSKSNPIV